MTSHLHITPTCCVHGDISAPWTTPQLKQTDNYQSLSMLFGIPSVVVLLQRCGSPHPKDQWTLQKKCLLHLHQGQPMSALPCTQPPWCLCVIELLTFQSGPDGNQEVLQVTNNFSMASDQSE